MPDHPPPPARPGGRLSDLQRGAVAELLRVAPVVQPLAERFAAAGERLALVGGTVRDALLYGRLGADWDFTTSARPEVTEALLAPWADAIWDVGRAFGTIGARQGGAQVEITTYRSDRYDATSRKPDVEYGDSLEGDLSRRDFTVNAMAVELPSRTFVDPFGGLEDLAAGRLRTPGTARQSFGDDPLRMMRAARFSAQLGFDAVDEVVAAIRDMSERIAIVSAERVRDELVKLVCSDEPRRGLVLLVHTGLADHVLPELPALRLERDEHHRHKDVYEHTLTVLEQTMALEARLGGGPDLVARLAALLHDIGKPRTRRFQSDGSVTFHHHDVVGAKLAQKRLRALRFPRVVVEQVSRLVELHLRFHGYGAGDWTDSAVRRYVRDAGDQLERLHVLTRADSTTRNARKAARLQRTYDDIEARIARLTQAEQLAAMRPDLDGNQIQQVLGVGPGPVVGQAYRHLLDLRIEHGPLGEDRAREELLAWWAAREGAVTRRDRVAMVGAVVAALALVAGAASWVGVGVAAEADQLEGTSGDDVLVGTDRGDFAVARAGDDRVRVLRGPDDVRAGRGADVVAGGAGRDHLYAGPGPDLVRAGAGDDVVELRPGGGSDRVQCGGGIDEVIGVGANESLRGCEVRRP